MKSPTWLGRAAQVIVATVISTGIITASLQHDFDKRFRTHELKMERYLALIDELSKWVATDSASGDFPVQMNAALCFSSDEVAVALLDLGQEMKSSARKIPTSAFKPLVMAIRRDLYLSSDCLQKRDLRFFTWVPEDQAIDRSTQSRR